MEQRSEEKFQERTIFHVCSPCRPEDHSFMPKQPKRGLHNTQFTKTFCLSPKCIKLAVKRHLDPSTCVCRPDWCHSQNSSEQREFPVQILIIWLFPALWVREWVTRPSIELSWESLKRGFWTALHFGFQCPRLDGLGLDTITFVFVVCF